MQSNVDRLRLYALYVAHSDSLAVYACLCIYPPRVRWSSDVLPLAQRFFLKPNEISALSFSVIFNVFYIFTASELFEKTLNQPLGGVFDFMKLISAGLPPPMYRLFGR